MDSDADPNVGILSMVAEDLGDLCDQLVFVGGCATGLLLTTVRAQAIRATDDVDVIAEAFSIGDYHEIEAAVRARGFVHDISRDAPICRWVQKDGVKLDLMPSEPVLGFHNRWYPLALKTALDKRLPTGRLIHLISAPLFIATKLEAFHGRGGGDHLLSHDLEDIVTVVDGREELLQEVRSSPPEIRSYLSGEMGLLLTNPSFMQAVPGYLPGDAASQARLLELLRRLRALAAVP